MADSVLPLIPFGILDDRGRGMAAAMDVGLDVDPTLAHVMDVDRVPESALPSLAAHVGIRGPLWSCAPDRRALIKGAIGLWQQAGTKAGLEQVLAFAGRSGASITDRADGRRYDGAIRHDSANDYGSHVSVWWAYRVALPVTAWSNADHEAVSGVLGQFAPARSHLERVTIEMALTTTLGAAPAMPAALRAGAASRRVRIAGGSEPGVMVVRGRLYPGDLAGAVERLQLVTSAGEVVADEPVAVDGSPELALDATWTLRW